MGIFNPVDMMGPAHRGGQLQMLAQNVIRRQKMKALLAGGARAAASASAGQPLASSLRLRPTGVHGATLRNPQQAILGMMQGGAHGGGNDFGNDGMLGQGGGGCDYPSLPSPSDPAQSPQSTAPNTAIPVPAAQASGAYQPPPVTTTTGALIPTTSSPNPAYPGGTIQTPQIDAPGVSGLVNLGNGMYYDPVTDSVRGMPAGGTGSFGGGNGLTGPDAK